MKQLMPSCWTDFQCIAGACRHSCCIGWEIDIDEDTLQAYYARTDTLGERLRSCIEPDGTPHFRLTEEERCPFLNSDNLCDIILTAGDQALCEICAKHPRYFNVYPDCVEAGLGLCCEEAVRLLLAWDGALTFTEKPITAMEDEEASEEYTFLRRERNRLIAALQDRSRPLSQRCAWNNNLSFEAFRELLTDLEYIDEEWHHILPLLREPEGSIDDPDPVWEKLLVCCVWRYYLMYGLQFWQESFALEFGFLSVRLLQAMFAYHRSTNGLLSDRDRIDLIRMWSSELEYSPENLDAIAQWLSEQEETEAPTAEH